MVIWAVCSLATSGIVCGFLIRLTDRLALTSRSSQRTSVPWHLGQGMPGCAPESTAPHTSQCMRISSVASCSRTTSSLTWSSCVLSRAPDSSTGARKLPFFRNASRSTISSASGSWPPKRVSSCFRSRSRLGPRPPDFGLRQALWQRMP